jgi:hypothetical protein
MEKSQEKEKNEYFKLREAAVSLDSLFKLKATKYKIKRWSVPRLQPRSRRRYRDSRQNLRTSASDTVSCYICGIAHLLQQILAFADPD